MKSRRLIVIFVVAVVVLLLAEWYGPGGVQRRGMRAASEFCQAIAPALASDARFSAVKTDVITHPSVRVYGEVPDARALEDLKSLVQAPPDAPFGVFFQVDVAEDATTRPGR